MSRYSARETDESWNGREEGGREESTVSTRDFSLSAIDQSVPKTHEMRLHSGDKTREGCLGEPVSLTGS